MAITINKFTLVVVSASASGHPTVTKWSPAAYEQPTLSSANKIMGVTMTDSTTSDQIAVMKRGILRDCSMQNAETWAVGDTLFAKSNGSISKTRQAGPLPQVIVGTVFDVTASLCAIDVDVRIIPSLGELSGVSQEAPVDKDVFIYNSTSHFWEPRMLVHTTDLTPASLLTDDHPQYQQRIQLRDHHTHIGEDIVTPSPVNSFQLRMPQRPAPHTHRVEDVIGAGTGSGGSDPMMVTHPRPHTHGGEDLLLTAENYGSLGSILTLGDLILASQIFGG